MHAGDQQPQRRRPGQAASQPAPAYQLPSMIEVCRGTVRGGQLERHRGAELGRQHLVVRPVRIPGHQLRASLSGQGQDIVDRDLEHVRDHHARQLRRPLQDDHHSFSRQQQPQIRHQRRHRLGVRVAVDQFEPAAGLPRQVQALVVRRQQRPECLDPGTAYVGPPLVHPGEHQLHHSIGLGTVPGQQVCGGLQQRPLALDHLQILVAAHRSHGLTSSLHASSANPPDQMQNRTLRSILTLRSRYFRRTARRTDAASDSDRGSGQGVRRRGSGPRTRRGRCPAGWRTVPTPCVGCTRSARR